MVKTIIPAYVMRPIRITSTVTLDACCDHRAMLADEDWQRHAAENLDQVTYEVMEAAGADGSEAG